MLHKKEPQPSQATALGLQLILFDYDEKIHVQLTPTRSALTYIPHRRHLNLIIAVPCRNSISHSFCPHVGQISRWHFLND